jgi:protein PhnA
MSVINDLQTRSGSKCELCGSTNNLTIFEVQPVSSPNANNFVLLCETCNAKIQNPSELNANHWHCLNESMWSEVPAVQVMAFRILHQLRNEAWTQGLLDMLYLDDDTLAWAKAGLASDDEDEIKHIDSNGNVLKTGDSVVLIKDLNVKGGGFTAKRGTAVRNISLVHDNPEHIEGRVEGQMIVILTKYVKKSS